LESNIPLFLLFPLLIMSAARFDECIINILSLAVGLFALSLPILELGLAQSIPLNDALIYAQLLCFSFISTMFLIVSTFNWIKLLDRQIVRSDRLKTLGVLTAGVAHEIHNPLSLMKGYLHIMRKNPNLPEDLAPLFPVLDKSMSRISKIINGLSRYSYKRDECVLEITRIKAKEFNTVVKLNISQDIMIVCDELLIQQVIINLINNAIEENSDQKMSFVEISFIHGDGFDEIIVKDSGQGISEKKSLKIFHPFYTTKDVGKGTGLGLSICQGIMKDHDGDLFYELRDGHTCFIAKFPSMKMQH